jgi:hypothetical protein
MAKKKKVVTESNVIPEPTPEVKKQSFKVLKQFQTSAKIYEVGDTFLHNDKRVINFLRTNKII